MVDRVVQLKVSGAIILQALEISVSQYPKLDGRFLAVSGINFAWDASKEPGSRVVSVKLWKDKSDLDLNRTYTVTVKEWLSHG